MKGRKESGKYLKGEERKEGSEEIKNINIKAEKRKEARNKRKKRKQRIKDVRCVEKRTRDGIQCYSRLYEEVLQYGGQRGQRKGAE